MLGFAAQQPAASRIQRAIACIPDELSKLNQQEVILRNDIVLFRQRGTVDVTKIIQTQIEAY